MAVAPNSSRLRSWLAGPIGSVILILLSAAVTYAVGEHLLLVRIPHLMLGKWVVAEGKYQGSTVEFLRDGTMISNLKEDGATVRIEGQIQVDGTALEITTRNNNTGKQVTDGLTMLELSAHHFVTQDERGEILIMTRAKQTPAP
ncbi:MAG TPA: hypothetical protein VE988_02140 [Gemmataceae bacterium]|nr:hypothetical protein [Gemmataceae bacterium]